MPTRRRDPVSVPRTLFTPSRPSYSHDYTIDDSISRAGLFSNAVLEDTEAAAYRSRGKDYDLLRNTHSAIPHYDQDYGSSRIRYPARYQSLPPASRNTTVMSARPSPPSASSSLRSLIHSSAPPPASLLSSKINTFLRESSVTPGIRPATDSLVSYKSHLDSSRARPLPTPSPRDESMSIVSYKSLLSDPSVSSPFSTRSSSRMYRGFIPSSPSSIPRSRSDYGSSLPSYRISLQGDDDDYNNGSSDEDEDLEPESYRRKYKIVRGRKALPSKPPSTVYYTSSGFGSDDDDDDRYSLVPEDRGMYSFPRPSGSSSLALSSYDCPHDGSYDADMAEMYDYVPFGPSRQGILELTQHKPASPVREIREVVDDDYVDDGYYHDDESSGVNSLPLPYPSPSTILTFPSIHPSLTSSTSSLSPITHEPSRDLTKTPISSFANNVMFDSVLSNTAARARDALRDSEDLANYRNASLVMSVEGSAVTEDGRNRYGFKYYPPPIPLKGSGVGIDERILGISSNLSSSPADSFIGDYLSRLKSLRNEIDDREEKGADRSYGRSVAIPRPIPSYSHSKINMPVHIAGRAHSVPVSSYKSRADGHGLSHRVDVFPLLESNTLLGKNKVQIPLFKGGDDDPRLTMLDKINIKAAIIGSKMEAEDGSKGKRKLRPQYAVDKSREPSRAPSQAAIYSTQPLQSTHLQASRSMPKENDRKPIRTVDGFTKPKNVMSWEHRLESRLSPDDLIYKPSSFGRMRDQVRSTQEKMDRHRQLLDRYLDTDVNSVTRNIKADSPISSAGTDPNNAPMSDLRRRLRRTLATTRNNPDYYKE